MIKLLKAEQLLEEISTDGLGNQFYEQLSNGSSIFTDELIKWVFTEMKGAALIVELEKLFTKLEIIEHHNNSYKLKVTKDNYSIGYLFGYMEDIKHSFEVSEYSVSSTSLE